MTLLSKFKHHTGKWYGQVLVLLLVFFAVRAYTQRDMIAGEAPVFHSVLLNAQTVNLQDFRGRPVLVHFWATWCPVCKLEQASIESISHDYPVLTISMQSGDDLEVQAFLQEHGLHYPVVNDAEGMLAQRYGVRGVPSSFFLDGKGRIRFIEVGYTSEWGMRLRMWWLN